jgi:DNA-binding NarL/FixJ family response regulator
MYDSAQLVRRALDGGAWGFISKNAAPESLVAAVRAVQAGRRYLSEGLSPALLARSLDDEAARLASLNQREFEIFRLLAEGRSAAECARLLNVSPKTVANNQTRIKEKLDVATSAALVHLALRYGLIDGPKA